MNFGVNNVKAILDTNPEVIRITPEGTAFARAQDSEHDAEPAFTTKSRIAASAAPTFL